MPKFAFDWRVTAGILTLALGTTGAIWAASAQPAVPDFSSSDKAWLRVGIPFLDPVSGQILGEDPEHPFSTRGVDAAGRDVNA